MPRALNFSPYGPRPRRSARLVLLWILVLALILALTFYLTSRDGEPSKVDAEVVMQKLRGGGGSLREKTSKATKGTSLGVYMRHSINFASRDVTLNALRSLALVLRKDT
ncbi:hypothetical protein F5Y14DRAFT_454250 [Nemania sp. NC0429]|nr:hypothetical protein F5Y14DRAFT_454250 [Nemania sp. NC0429]